MVAMTRLRISPCEPAGAGRSTLTMVPGGVITSIGRKEPWFKGACGSNTDLTVISTPAAETAAVEFTGNGTCGDAPVKSAIMRSPLTVSAKGRSSGSKTANKGLQIVFVVTRAIGDRRDRGAHACLGSIEVETNGFEQGIDAVACADFVDPPFRHPTGGQAGLEVA